MGHSSITLAFIIIVGLACFTALIFAGVALFSIQSLQNHYRGLHEKEPLQDPTCIGQLFVGPEEQGCPSGDFDFVFRGGRLAYMYMFIQDPFDNNDQLLESRPTELTDSFITISHNGEAFVRKMPIHSLPSKTKLDLCRALDGIVLQPLDIISIEINGEENMYRSVGLSYGVVK